MSSPIVEALAGDGVVAVPAATIWPDYEQYRLLIYTAMAEFQDRTERKPNLYRSPRKPFLFYQKACMLDPLTPALSRIGEHLFGQPAHGMTQTLWRTVPSPVSEKVYSQKWHRDHEAKQVLKVFLHTSPVGLEQGPFQYVKNSAPPNDLNLCVPKGYANEGVEMPEDRIYTGLVGADTVVLAQTTGIHRGGNTTAGHRLQAMWGFIPKG